MPSLDVIVPPWVPASTMRPSPWALVSQCCGTGEGRGTQTKPSEEVRMAPFSPAATNWVPAQHTVFRLQSRTAGYRNTNCWAFPSGGAIRASPRNSIGKPENPGGKLFILLFISDFRSGSQSFRQTNRNHRRRLPLIPQRRRWNLRKMAGLSTSCDGQHLENRGDAAFREHASQHSFDGPRVLRACGERWRWGWHGMVVGFPFPG